MSSLNLAFTSSMASLQLGSLSTLNTLSEHSAFDWSNEDYAWKWKGQFVESLGNVLKSIHAQQFSFTAEPDALDYVEGLLVKLLAMMTAKPVPTTVSDVEKRVSHTLPTPIDKWAMDKAQRALKRGRRKSPMFLPVEKIHSLLKEVFHNHRLDEQVSLYIVAVLEYIAADILKLACNYVIKIRHNVISCQDIKTAMCADTVLMDMFEQDEFTIEYTPTFDDTSANQTYSEVVKDLIMDEKQYLRDLQMITKVFRDLIHRHNIAEPHEIEVIFSNINEIVELTVTLIGSLEDTLEMTEDGNFPAVGSCFEELAEGEEFDVYEKYIQTVLSADCRLTLEGLLSRKDAAEKLITSGKGFYEAVKFYLPKLLQGPIYHCSNYFRYIETLTTLKTSNDDADALTQAAAMLTPLQNKLQMAIQQAGPFAKRKSGNLYPRCGPNRVSRQQSLQKLSQIQQSIVNWEGKDIASNSSEVVYDGKLHIFIENRRRVVERYVYLCDGMILICKMNKKGLVGSGGGGGSSNDLKLCLKHLIRRLDVHDRKDSDDLKHAFELIPRDQPKIVFKADSAEEKNNWMAALVMLNTKSMLERRLDINLSKEETKHPLRFPPSDRYKFSEPDTNQNIVFEDPDKSNGIPMIKGATLVKLVERLTFHMHADPMFVKAFLTTYRSFSNPNELLDLLIERFQIPDPEFSVESASDSEIFDKKSEIQIAQDMKRFRKEYKQPVQFRVLNVLKHWVDEHFYDFEQDGDLLNKLTSFLDTISCKNMKKWVDCISKIVQRRQSNEEANRDIIFDFDRSPPELEVHIEKPEPGWPELLTYHPIEIARQLTLLEFDYYRAVKPSELVDQAWMKEDKDKRSPNLLRMVRHTTMFTLYLEKLIVEAENIDERTCVIQRALEIMMVLLEYNNFNGVIAITSAMNSSSVHRLVLRIKDKIPNHLLKALEEASSLVPDHFKIYWEKLRSLNPPCVPFFGQYQTNILFLEEGNPNFLHNNPDLINFTKWRKVAEIISEIQQYQNQPYCLKACPELKNFLQNLAPFPGMTEKAITDYLWEKSIELEPRGTETLRKKSSSTENKAKWKGLNLKSPGIKKTGKNHPNPLPRILQPNRSNTNQSDNSSPLTSPVFQFSPSSIPPTTPFATPSPAKSDPIKAMVMLPSHSATPPQLPPKPRPSNFFSGHNFSSTMTSSRPPIMSRTSSPPPPLPPRRDQMALLPRQTPTRSSFEIRSPSSSDRNSSTSPPPPPRLPRQQQQHSTHLHNASRPSPLNIRQSHEGPSPSPSPLWSGTSSIVSPSGWSVRNGPPPYSTPTGPLPPHPGARPDFRNTEQHFNFSQNSVSSGLGLGTSSSASALSPTSPILPPRRPVQGSSLDAFQMPRDNYERVNEWLQSPSTPELLMQ